MENEMEDDRRSSEASADGDGEDASPESEDSNEKKKRTSSFGFDDYRFETTVLDDQEDADARAEQDAKVAEDKFITMARLKTTDYSKMDIERIASTMGMAGLPLDESMVEPVPIPKDEEDRDKAVQAIYGPDMKTETEPFKDPLTALQTADEEKNVESRIPSPPNLYETLQSNFLKTNYKTPLYRLFLLGTHDENLSLLIEYNRDVIENINGHSYTELLQGVLCVYEYYYIHVVEGSEDNLIRLIQKYANDLEPSGYEWDLKFHHRSVRYSAREHVKLHTVQSWVLGMFRIHERQLSNWKGEKVFPNKMYHSDIPPGGFRERYFHFIRHCTVMAFVYNRLIPTTTGFDPKIDNEDVTSQVKKAIEKAKIQRFKSLGKVVTPATFIQYVLDHKDNPKLKIRSIREYLELFGGTPPYVSSSSTEWPAPGRVAPYD